MDHLLGVELRQPVTVEGDLGQLGVEDLEDLGLVGLGVGQHLLLRQGRARLALTRGITDHRGEVTHQEDDVVTELLELPHLVHHHRVPDVQVRGGGVEPHLDPQRLAPLELVGQRLLHVGPDLRHHTSADDLQLALNVHWGAHGSRTRSMERVFPDSGSTSKMTPQSRTSPLATMNGAGRRERKRAIISSLRMPITES